MTLFLWLPAVLGLALICGVRIWHTTIQRRRRRRISAVLGGLTALAHILRTGVVPGATPGVPGEGAAEQSVSRTAPAPVRPPTSAGGASDPRLAPPAGPRRRVVLR